MANVTEQMLFDFFVEQNQKLNLAELSQHFNDTTPEELSQLVNSLVAKKFLDEDLPTRAWHLSSRAKRLLQQEQERTKLEQKQKELPLETTSKNPAPAKKMFFVPGYTKWMLWIALLLALGFVVLVLVKGVLS